MEKRQQKGSFFFENSETHLVPHNIVKYAENTETIIGEDLAKILNKSWNFYYFSNELRTFIFKLHNNTLPYNTILSHFVPSINRNCHVKKNPIMIQDPVLQYLENQSKLVFNAIGRTMSPNRKYELEREVVNIARKISNLETEETARLLYWEKLLKEARIYSTGLNLQTLQGLTAVEMELFALIERYKEGPLRDSAT
jgi:hypothetical protein